MIIFPYTEHSKYGIVLTAISLQVLAKLDCSETEKYNYTERLLLFLHLAEKGKSLSASWGD